MKETFSFQIKHKIGERIKTESRIYTVIGYEYIKGRALRYALLYVDNGKTDWLYLYEFEIKSLTSN